MGGRFLGKDVKSGPVYPSFFEGQIKRLLVDNLSSRSIYEICGRLHP